MPIKYLDPKNDLTFRRVFGEHPHLLISFLNAMLPLEENRIIKSIEYLDSEIIPELPGLKRSIVDVRCTDNFKRQFIVEMQMYWTGSFRSRMLFNASKAYVKQLQKREKFSELKPVYGLSLVNEDFMTGKGFEDIYYHHYRFVHNMDSNDQIKGIELIFVELQKFKSLNFTDKKLKVLWLKFLTLIDENTTEVPEELQNEASIKEALDYMQESAFSPEEMEYYEKYWDTVRVEKTAIADVLEKEQEKQALLEQMIEEAQQREKEERKQKEEAQNKLKAIVIKQYKKGRSVAEIADEMDLTEIEVKRLIEENKK